MRKGKIQVVLHNGELLFRSDGVLLDKLEAHDFYYAKIVVSHNGKETDSGVVHEIGTHAQAPIFEGLQKMRDGLAVNVKNMYCHALLPTYFSEGDEISFEIDGGFEWEVDFKKSYAMQQVIKKLQPLSNQVGAIVDDAEYEREHHKYVQKLEEEFASFVFPPRIIFRRHQPIVVRGGPKSN